MASPDENQFGDAAARLGRLKADEDFVANIDRTNYQNFPQKTDKQGRITFPALIPGATYRLSRGQNQLLKQFTVTPGQQLDLGTIDNAGQVIAPPATKPAQAKPPISRANWRPRVTGQITLPDGKPAAGADVAVIAFRARILPGGELFEPGEVLAEGTTDSAGIYRLRLKVASSETHHDANVIARQPGYGIVWQEFNLDRPASNVSLALPPEEPIRGRLVDLEGQPVAGARLSIERIRKTTPGQRTTDNMRPFTGVAYYRSENIPAVWIAPIISDAEGRFTLHGIPAGHGAALMFAGSERLAPQEIALNTGMAAEGGEPGFSFRPYWPLVRNVAAGEEALLPLAPAQWFEGVVTSADTGKPIPHAQLSISALQQEGGGGAATVTGQADDLGRYRINPHPGIRFILNVHPPAGTPYLAWQTSSGDPIRWQVGDRLKQVDLKLPRGVLVRGTIVEAGTNTPIARATVQYVPLDSACARLRPPMPPTAIS